MKILVQAGPFDPGALLAAFTAGRTDVGGVVSFTGLARDDGGPNTTLELEAYPGFTEKEIGRIGAVAVARFSLLNLLVVHRTGEMKPGDAIVFVAAAARHRREAFEAADFMMDYLKSRAPFWKKESGENGSRWVEPSTRDHADAARWDATLRRATRDDHPAMEALQARASLAGGEHAEALRANPHVIVTDMANVEAGRAVVAERDGRLIGFITLEAADDLKMEIEGLFVEPDHWRQGLGARLMAEAETMARAAGARTLIVTVGQVAKPFYQSQGFVGADEAATLFGRATRMQKLL